MTEPVHEFSEAEQLARMTDISPVEQLHTAVTYYIAPPAAAPYIAQEEYSEVVQGTPGAVQLPGGEGRWWVHSGNVLSDDERGWAVTEAEYAVAVGEAARGAARLREIAVAELRDTGLSQATIDLILGRA